MSKTGKKPTVTSLGTTDEVKKVFSKFDANGDGKISLTELLTALGSSTSQNEAKRVMTELDVNGDGFIDVHEFADACHVDGPDEADKDVRDAFEMYDKDRNGVISARELHAVMKALGEKCSLRECIKMIRSVDVDGDGCVNFEEFKKMMRC